MRSSSKLFVNWSQFYRQTTAPVYEQYHTWSEAGFLLIQTFRRIPQKECWRWSEICQAIVQYGIGSVPIVTLSTAFAGIAVTHQLAWHMKVSLHDVSMIPGFASQFIFRELGIAVPALLMVAKAGAAITAEVGSMKVTEQLDALKLLRIDPINYLVFPRFVAAIVSGACITLFAITSTLGCALLVTTTQYGFGVLEFINGVRHFIGVKDLVCALMKGIVYGGVIPIVSCAYGFRCKGGAEGVGTATTNSVVAATVAIISLDFLLTYLFTLIL